jgi:hypothetical protein
MYVFSATSRSYGHGANDTTMLEIVIKVLEDMGSVLGPEGVLLTDSIKKLVLPRLLVPANQASELLGAKTTFTTTYFQVANSLFGQKNKLLSQLESLVKNKLPRIIQPPATNLSGAESPGRAAHRTRRGPVDDDADDLDTKTNSDRREYAASTMLASLQAELTKVRAIILYYVCVCVSVCLSSVSLCVCVSV